MIKTIIALLLIVFTVGLSQAQRSKRKLLLFTKTTGFYHKSITAGIAAIVQLGTQNGFAVDTTTNSAAFTDNNLQQYAAIIFLSTTGNVFDTAQKQSLMKYIRSGGGFVGIHAASDTEMDWPWYIQLVGAAFAGHPKPQEANILVTDSTHPATRTYPVPGGTRMNGTISGSYLQVCRYCCVPMKARTKAVNTERITRWPGTMLLKVGDLSIQRSGILRRHIPILYSCNTC